ncbi:hypothetical protein ACN38_g12886, partial [Penicillium nordicum]
HQHQGTWCWALGTATTATVLFTPNYLPDMNRQPTDLFYPQSSNRHGFDHE